MNHYAFNQNNPIVLLDFLGLQTIVKITDEDLKAEILKYWRKHLKGSNRGWRISSDDGINAAGSADTERFHGTVEADKYEYEGKCYIANEVNYIAAGAYVKYHGPPLGIPGLGILSVHVHNWGTYFKPPSSGKKFFYNKGKELLYEIDEIKREYDKYKEDLIKKRDEELKNAIPEGWYF